MAWDDMRLETNSGDVIIYFAPAMEWEDTWTNDSNVQPLPGGDNQAQIFDLSQWVGEVTVQGQFEDSRNLPPEHRQALQDLGFSLPVTAEQQVAYAINQIVFNPDPPYHLYLPGREYTANTPNQIDPVGGVYPTVSVSEIRTPEEAGLSRQEYLFRFNVGFVTTSEPEEESA